MIVKGLAVIAALLSNIRNRNLIKALSAGELL